MSTLRQDWDWTGRNDETGNMMQLAVEKPKIFCRLVGKAFLSVPKNKRRTLKSAKGREEC